MISHPLECKKFEDNADIVLVRNIWPLEKYLKKWNKILSRFKRKNKKIYNHPSGLADMKGKYYLLDLYKKGFRVIPSVDKIKDLCKIPETKYYIIKPIYGGGSIGVKKLSKKQLLKTKLQNYIIQPYINFKYETSFYFIDGKFQYELYEKDKKNRWDLRHHKVKKQDREFAENFIKWNKLKYGIQRIDACRTKDNKLLLMEIEDFCPYLSIPDIKEKLRSKFIRNLIKSINKI
ncbi:hypothetical protein J4230_02255 [Candidatus Woesearchaeota archaeon]|nr:hypothetical protein [Candidatus Woesearchaeota archaeon]